MFNHSLSHKSLMKKVNYLLSTVNLSYSMLVGLRKGTIYRLLKKAAKINPDLHLEKDQLKEVARQISQYSLTAKQAVKVYKKILKLKDLIEVEQKQENTIIFEEEIYLGTFFDKKQIIRV